jgi:uncharacterized delta-60 repeat protein
MFIGQIRLVVLASLTLLASLAAAPAASAAPGGLDPSFGSGGIVKLFPNNGQISLRAVATQADNKIVLAGGEEPGNVILVRLLESGAFDPGFGVGGKVTTPFPGGFGEARAVAIQPDGKIVIAGSAKGAAKTDFLVARYNADGSPDAGFGGGDGIQVVPIGTLDDIAEGVSIGADGHIAVTGRVDLTGGKTAAGVLVLKADGTPDPGFSTDGLTLVETTGAEKSDRGEDVVEQPDGKFVIADSTGDGAGNGFTVVRLLGNGLPDPEFGGGDGVVTTPVPPGTAMGSGGRATDLVLLPDGRIVASGYGYDEVGAPPKPDGKTVAVAYLANGDLDLGFGGAGTGIFTQQVAPGSDSARTILRTPPGQLLLAGSYDVAESDSPAVLRLTPAGLLDPGFGVGGQVLRGVTAPFGESFEDAALDPEERLVMDSTAYVGNNVTETVITRILGDKVPKGPENKAPHARMKKVPKKVKAAKLKRFSGTASDPEGAALTVQVAVVKLLKSGAQPKKAIGSCWVMKNAKGKFKRIKAEATKGDQRCPQRWLAVKGKAKWSFKLKKQLPPGRYVVYARAVDTSGLAESAFSRKAGNRYAFRILPPR